MDGVFLSQFDGDKDAWVTDNEVPDPNPLPTMFGWNILVRPLRAEKELKTKGGGVIHLADTTTDDIEALTNVGKVLALGSQAYRDPEAKEKNPHGKYGHKWCEPGDFVVWGRHRGQKLKIKGVSCVILADDEILMKLEDPSDLSRFYNIGSSKY